MFGLTIIIVFLVGACAGWFVCDRFKSSLKRELAEKQKYILNLEKAIKNVKKGE